MLALAAASPLWGGAMRGRAAPRPRTWSFDLPMRWATALATACLVGVVIWHSNSVPPATQKPVAAALPAEGAPKTESPKPEKPPAVTPRMKVKRPLRMQGAAVQSRAAPTIVAGAP